MGPAARNRTTLIWCTVLHAFTHAYGTMLVPLYLMMTADLRLSGDRAAALVVTVYGVVWCAGSYPAGILADRFNRKKLLSIGLLGHAVAMLLIGVSREYWLILVLAAVAGTFGSLFHPAGTALVSELYPRSPGTAIGLLGAGAGLGFFAGPQYAGWRAQHATWHFGWIADWQRPCVELGLMGIVAAVIFMVVAHEPRPDGARPVEHRRPMGPALRRRMLAVAAVLGCRDFAGVAVISLASIYLQKAQRMDVARAGFILGAMMLVGTIVNPLAVWLSPGRRRLAALTVMLTAAGAILATVPLWPGAQVLAVLVLFQALHLGTYPVGDAAMMERVAPAVRGRIVGMFLSTAGTVAAMSSWVMVWWTDALHGRAGQAAGYVWPFGVLGLMMALSALSAPIIARLGRAGGEVGPSDVDGLAHLGATG